MDHQIVPFSILACLSFNIYFYFKCQWCSIYYFVALVKTLRIISFPLGTAINISSQIENTEIYLIGILAYLNLINKNR